MRKIVHSPGVPALLSLSYCYFLARETFGREAIVRPLTIVISSKQPILCVFQSSLIIEVFHLRTPERLRGLRVNNEATR